MDKNVHKMKSGLITGFLQTIMFYPLDVIHLRYFLMNQETRHRHLYSGLAFTLFGNLLKKSILFPIQDISSNYAKYKDLRYPNFFNALIGGAVGLCLTPINSICVPLQLNPINTLGNTCLDIYRYRGIFGFYRGGLGIFFRNFIWTFVYFPTFDYFLNLYQSILMSSLVSAIIATTVSYPLDGSRIYRQHHLHNYSFTFGIRRSFDPTMTNITSFLVGNMQITLSVCFAHCMYLMVRDRH